MPLISFVLYYIIEIVCFGYRLYTRQGDFMDYLSIKQTSEKWGISTRRIQVLCGEDRIPGATKIGSYWAIPSDAEKPKDERVKTGRYAKKVFENNQEKA